MKREENDQQKSAKEPVEPVIKYELEVDPDNYKVSYWRKEKITRADYFNAIKYRFELINNEIDNLINLGKFKL